MLTGRDAAKKRKPRRNVRLRARGEGRKVQREAGFGIRLICFFCKKLFAVVGLLILTLLFILGYDYFTQTERLALTEVKVLGNKALSADEIIAASGVKPGVNLFKMDVAGIKQKLLSLEWVKAVEITRDLPFRLILEITEQDALVCADLGQIFIVNTDGYVFKPALAENTRAMPTVRGLNIPAEYWVDAPDFCLWTASRGISPLEVNKISALQEFLQLCEKHGDVMALECISDIEADGLTGITAILRDGRVVKFGFGNLRKKFSNYSQLMAYANQAFGAQEIKVVDLRDTARIVVKREAVATP